MAQEHTATSSLPAAAEPAATAAADAGTTADWSFESLFAARPSPHSTRGSAAAAARSAASDDKSAAQHTSQSTGIPDRRASGRPGDRPARGRGSQRGKGRAPARTDSGRTNTSMSSVRDAMTISEDDSTPGEKDDQFEDASSTPKPVTPEPSAEQAPKANGHIEGPQSDEPKGLGITGDGIDNVQQQTVATMEGQGGEGEKSPTTNAANRLSYTVGDEYAYLSNEIALSEEKPTVQDSATTQGSDAVPSIPEETSRKTSMTEDRLMPAGEEATPPQDKATKRLSLLDGSAHLSPAPSTTHHERSRSRSPARFPVKRQDQSPPKAAPSESSSQPPPSLTDRIPVLEPPPAPATRPQSASPPPQRPGIGQKVSSGLGGILGRAMSIRKTARSPPAPRQEGKFGPARRGTAGTIASIDGTASAAVPASEADDSKNATLHDQFQRLRRQTENEDAVGPNGGILEEDNERTPVAKRGSDSGITPTSPIRRGSETWPRHASTPNILKTPPINASLPPGTASGMSAGPAENSTPVNWELWERVVDEGPSAVQKTSGEELRHALAGGIPSTIRGVVWQALAESKDENLEGMYRVLKARGSENEQSSRPGVSRTNTDTSSVGVINEEESADSSRNSVHSESSTPATSNIASPPPSVVEAGAGEVKDKLLAEKQKREAAAIAKLEKAIKRDLGSRTSYSKYTQSAGLQDGLLGVCKAFALFDEGVGYAQGMNFIAVPLLFNMTEEEAFSLLVRLMGKYEVRSLFTAEMPGLHKRLYQFERLLEDHDPALYCHLRRRNVHPQLYATQWFLTLFAYRFPLQLVLRIYDLIFSEGLAAILKFGIVLMQRNRDTLLGMKDMSQLTNFLKEKLFDVYIDKSPSASSLLDSGFFGSVTGGADKELYRAEEMVRDACGIIITEETLSKYTSEWEETQRVEREREIELETLRSANTSLSAQIRALEERVQQHDTEHVNIAGDLVRTKVENNELQDENEGLKIKMEELQRMVDVQPAEVEEKLKEEMDRIMQRNIEVQNENRHIKEEMDEMEHELVNSKMAHAELLSDHDTLKQKWSSVQALLNDRT